MSSNSNDPPSKKPPEVDAVTGPAPLGMAAFPDGLPQLTPGDKIKGAEGYWHGSVTGEVNYWRGRARAAEERLRLRLAEVETMRKILQTALEGEKSLEIVKAIVVQALGVSP